MSNFYVIQYERLYETDMKMMFEGHGTDNSARRDIYQYKFIQSDQ